MNFFNKLQSMGGNYVSRLGGADILKQDQLQELKRSSKNRWYA